MFDIGFWELSIIGVVALVVIGPERLPAVARTAGKWVGKANRLISSVKDDISKEIDNEDLKKILEEQQKLAQDFKKAAGDTSASINQFDPNELLAIEELEESNKKKKAKSKKKKIKKKKLKAEKKLNQENVGSEETNKVEEKGDTPAVTKLIFDDKTSTNTENESPITANYDANVDTISDTKNTSNIESDSDKVKTQDTNKTPEIEKVNA